MDREVNTAEELYPEGHWPDYSEIIRKRKTVVHEVDDLAWYEGSEPVASPPSTD